MTDMEILGAAMSYTDKTVEGAGGLKGANCTIQSIVDITGGHRVTFAWKDNDDNAQTSVMDVMDGEKGSTGETGPTGIGIASIEKTGTSGLVDTYTITYTNGDTDTFTVTNGSDATVTVDSELSDESENPVQNKIIKGVVDDLEEWTTAEAKSVSGNPITLLDGSARNAENLAVECEPKQNLHGYDHPWAGGAGKNKLPLVLADIKSANTGGTWNGNVYTLNDITYTIQTDEDGNVTGIKSVGQASAFSALFLPFTAILTGNYILTGSAPNGSGNTWNLRLGKGASDTFVTFDAGSGASFTAENDVYRARLAIMEGANINGTWYPMIRLASVSDATFEPYTNECPITGYTECVVDDDGKNLLAGVEGGAWNYRTLTKESNAIRARSTEIINAKPSTTYTMMLTPVGGKIIRCSVAQSSSDGTLLSDSGWKDLPYTFTTENNCAKMVLSFKTTADDSNPENYISNPQLELGDRATNYAPYVAPTSATITFGQTVYGGSVDFKTGKVTVTKAYKVFDGTENWYVQANANRVYTDNLVDNIAKPSASGTVADITSNIFGAISSSASYTGTRGVSVGTSGYVEFADGIGGMTVNAWKTYLENNTVAVCYELANPVELTLTPAELELLKGYNYITTNGTTIALAYLPDSLLAEAENYVDAKIPRTFPADKVMLSDGVTSVEDKMGNMRMGKLWENPNPSSSFPGQQIALSMDGYDLIFILFKNHTNSDNMLNVVTLNGHGVLMLSATDVLFSRVFDTNTKTFTNGFRGSTVDDVVCIPYQIYGIKLT